MDDFMKNFDNIPDNVKDMLNSFVKNSNNSTNSKSQKENCSSDTLPNIDMDTILKMQKIVTAINSEQSDSRANLLRSLKPYLKPNRQKEVDQYIKLFNMEKVLELFNNGGENNDL